MGIAFLLKRKTGENTSGREPFAYKTLAGLRASDLSLATTVSVSAAGIFLDREAENAIRAHALAGTIDEYELSFEDGERLRGSFLVQRLDYSGDFNGERNYTLHMESVGEVVSL